MNFKGYNPLGKGREGKGREGKGKFYANLFFTDFKTSVLKMKGVNMHVNKIQSNNNPAFGAVRVSRVVRENQRLMETVMESHAIRKMIEANEAKGFDTEITLYQPLKCAGRYFEILSGKDLDKSQLCYNYMPEDGIEVVIDYIKKLDRKFFSKKVDEWIASFNKQ